MDANVYLPLTDEEQTIVSTIAQMTTESMTKRDDRDIMENLYSFICGNYSRQVVNEVKKIEGSIPFVFVWGSESLVFVFRHFRRYSLEG